MSNNKNVNLSMYIDLTDESCDLSRFEVRPNRFFTDCEIIDNTSNSASPTKYEGFILAKSSKGNAFTVCDVGFFVSDKDKKFATRIKFRRTDETLQNQKIRSGNDQRIIDFSSGENGYREFWKMIAFLEKFREWVDVGEYWGSFQTFSNNDISYAINNKTSKEKKELLSLLANAGDLDDEDIIAMLEARSRKKSLDIFRRLLANENNYREFYREKHSEIRKNGDEAIWHFFFRNNQWIFGLALDLRFMDDILDEQFIGEPNTNNSGNPNVDFLGISDFTTLVEIKKPETKFFTTAKLDSSRANTWSFSSDFIDGISQCLGQKEAWSKKSGRGELIGNDGQTINENIIRTVDPKVIFIVGNKQAELPVNDTSKDNNDKRDTLERFIRNNKNISIVSYDELYKRAEKIVNLEQK